MMLLLVPAEPCAIISWPTIAPGPFETVFDTIKAPYGR